MIVSIYIPKSNIQRCLCSTSVVTIVRFWYFTNWMEVKLKPYVWFNCMSLITSEDKHLFMLLAIYEVHIYIPYLVLFFLICKSTLNILDPTIYFWSFATK